MLRKALLLMAALLLSGAPAYAQSSLDSGNPAAALFNRPLYLGTGVFQAGGITNTPISGSTGAFTSLNATGAVSLTGSGTALSVSNSATFGSANASTVSLSSDGSHGYITSNGSLAFVQSSTSTPGFLFEGAGGVGVIINNPSSTVTGRLNIGAGVNNNPIVFSTANSTNPNQGYVFGTSSGQGAQVIFITPSFAGTYSGPGTNPYNCGGGAGFVLVCSNGDTLAEANINETQPGAQPSLTVVREFGGTANGSTTTGGRSAADDALVLTAATGDIVNQFYVSHISTDDMRAPAGGAQWRHIGSAITDSIYATLESDATNFHELGGTEADLTLDGTVDEMHGYSIFVLGATSSPFNEATGYTIGAGSTGGAPVIMCAFCAGRFEGGNALASGAMLIGFLPTGYTGMGPSIADAADFRLASYSDAMIAGNGGYWNGTTLALGHTIFSDSAGGMTIAPTASTATTASVATAGSGYNQGAALNFTDGYHGIWQAQLTLIARPTTLTLTAFASGGALATGTIYVEITYLGNGGETVGSTEASVSVTGPTGEVVVQSPGAATNATGYNVYAASASGYEMLQNTSPVAIGTNYTIASLATGTATPPASNTAGIVSSVTNLSPPIVSGTPPATLTLHAEGAQGGTGATISPTWTTGANVTVAGGAQLKGVTVASLPTCNSGEEGTLYYVTDATSPAYNATLTGGGTVFALAACNGSAWTAH